VLGLGRRERLDRHLIPDRFRPWHRDAIAAIREHDLLRDVDALVTFGQPMSDHLVGLALQDDHKLPWIVHLSDPWSDNPFAPRNRLGSALNRRLEMSALSRAAALLVTNSWARDRLVERLPAEVAKRVQVLPHAFDPRLYPPATTRSGSLRVRYIGSLYGPRGPRPLTQALDLLRARGELDDVKIELIGPTTHRVDAPGLIERPSVQYLESLALMRNSDLLLNLEAPIESSPFLPSKLVDYVGARVPIAALAPEGPGAALVRRVGGWQADPADPEAAAAMLAEALGHARRARDSSVWGDEATVETYSARNVAAEARRLFADAIASPPG
jgi:hypothetical protein